MSVSVRYQGEGRSSVRCSEIKRRATRMLRKTDSYGKELSVLLCDDLTIRELNRLYRQEDHPTDVLSFSMVEGEPIKGSPSVLGDIVISLPTAIRQAATHQHEPLEEVTVLLAHGLLHLLGFDHRTRAEKRSMQARVERLVAATKQKS
jgi:probable rRNA maturation factor